MLDKPKPKASAYPRVRASEARRFAAGAVRKTLILPPDAARRAGEIMAQRGVTFTGLVVEMLRAEA